MKNLMKYVASATFLCAAIVPASFSTAAFGADSDNNSFYVKASGGFNFGGKKELQYKAALIPNGTANNITFDTFKGYAISVDLGCYVSDNFRTELGGAYVSVQSEKKDDNKVLMNLRSVSAEVMASAYYDVANISDVMTPYIGLGVGYLWTADAITNINTVDATGTDTDQISKLTNDATFKESLGAVAGKLQAGFQIPLGTGITLDASYALKVHGDLFSAFGSPDTTNDKNALEANLAGKNGTATPGDILATVAAKANISRLETKDLKDRLNHRFAIGLAVSF